ncbi:MAG: DNA mismatch repair endonuclease MutL [Muribaculaceae bacterium]|nr:DNA mismatch repair endonuclease MutL [Muribaculaceae bacterium]
MSDVIRLLPDSVANQIAAGEVIQQPSSVVKELVENAVDAGATDIHIIIKDAGSTKIQVIDNGCGMSETDARMAFERHATSKITKADDLFALHTMGFRGEALPSICAISEVEVRTRTAQSSIGTLLLIKGSKVESQEPCVCDVGTIITVRNLYYNVPARRKFLKSANVETSRIMREFERLAIVNNNIRLRLDTDTRSIDLRPAALRLRIEDIWKNNLKSDHLIPVNVETALVNIEGFVSRPEFARRRNPLQYLIVNGRNMRHPYFRNAIMSCYEGLIAGDTQPCFFMKFTVDPASIDVNIHPTKNEIKFEYEQQIWPIIVSAVKTALGKYSAVPSIDFSIDALRVNPLIDKNTEKAPSIEYKKDYNPFDIKRPARATTRVESNWEKLYENFNTDADNSSVGITENPGSESDIFTDSDHRESQDFASPICMQIGLKYIVTTLRGGLVLIDQHRAHVKILYEEYMSRDGNREVVSQRLMFPEAITLDETQREALLEATENLEALGFNLEYSSGNEWLVNSVPVLPPGTPAADVVLRILDSVNDDREAANYGTDSDPAHDMQSRIALVMARAAAIRRGQRLSTSEMENLVSSLFALPDPSLTPAGNLVFTLLDDKRLASLLSL